MEASWDNIKLEANHAVSRGDFGAACDLWIKALEQLDSVADEDPRVALTLDRLADTLCKAGRTAQAVPILEHCVELKEKVLGSDHIELANTLNNLAELFYSMGKFEKAQPLSERIMTIYEKVFGAEHLGLAMIATFLALIYHGQKDFDKAEALYKRALSIKQKVLGYNHSEVGLLMENYAALLYATNRTEEADNLCSNVGTVSGLWKSIHAQTTASLTQGSIGSKLRKKQ